jgi:hypothetical protein
VRAGCPSPHPRWSADAAQPLLLPLLLLGCAGKEPGSITVPLQWAAAPTEGTLRPAGRTVEVSLQEGSVSFADLRLHAPAAAARRWGPADLLVGRAHAHPGHDPAGDVRLEALGAWTEDLLGAGDGASLGALSGREGEVATASLRLHAGAPQTLVGLLTEGGQQLPFALSVTIDDPIEGGRGHGPAPGRGAADRGAPGPRPPSRPAAPIGERAARRASTPMATAR